MLFPIVIALILVWAIAAVFAVSLCVISGRADRRGPLFLVGSRS